MSGFGGAYAPPNPDMNALRGQPGAGDSHVVSPSGDASCVELGEQRQRVLATHSCLLTVGRDGEATRFGVEQSRRQRCRFVDRVTMEQHAVALDEDAATRELADGAAV